MITPLRTMLIMEVRNEYGDVVNMPRMIESLNIIPIIDRISVIVLAHLLPIHKPYARIKSITPNSEKK
jgi:hypothetical protein